MSGKAPAAIESLVAKFGAHEQVRGAGKRPRPSSVAERETIAQYRAYKGVIRTVLMFRLEAEGITQGKGLPYSPIHRVVTLVGGTRVLKVDGNVALASRRLLDVLEHKYHVQLKGWALTCSGNPSQKQRVEFYNAHPGLKNYTSDIIQTWRWTKLSASRTQAAETAEKVANVLFPMDDTSDDDTVDMATDV